MGHKPQTAQQQKMVTGQMQRQTRQDTTIKSLEQVSRQGKHASLTFSRLTEASWLLMADTAVGVFPEKILLEETLQSWMVGWTFFISKWVLAPVERVSQSLPSEAIASTSPQLGMIICLFSRENCCPVSTLPCDKGGLATTCRPQ